MAGKAYGEMVFSRVSLKEYIEWFRECDPDILALSEVHMEQEDGTSSMVETIAAELQLPYYSCCCQSSSHLDTSKFMGLAVLSKYPIERERQFRLPNPCLTVTRPDGSRWTMFDKGAQCLQLNVDGKQVTVFNLHYFPFHHFRRRMNEEAFDEIRQQLVGRLLPKYGVPTIVTGDFNNKDLALEEAFPELFQSNKFRRAVVAETTVVGLQEQFDHILYTPDVLEVEHSFAASNYSDHYAVSAEFLFT